MDRNITDILAAVSFLKDHMATRDDIAELRAEIRGLGDHVRGLKNKIGAIHDRFDDEAAERRNLESRARKVLQIAT